MCGVKPKDEDITEIRVSKIRAEHKPNPNFNNSLTHGLYMA
jgi:hypothetical protein